MRIEFELTSDEFLQAQKSHAGNTPALRTRGDWPRQLITLALLLGFGVVYYFVNPWANNGERPNLVLACLVLPPIPWIITLTKTWLAVYQRRQFLPPWKPGCRIASLEPSFWTRWRRWIPISVQSVGMIAMVILACTKLNAHPPTPGGDESFLAAFIVVMLPNTIYSVWASLLATTTLRGQSYRAWELQTQLHCRHVFDIDINGATVTTPTTRIEYRWNGFAGSLETPTEFLLYPSPALFHIVPKRAFATAEDAVGLGHLLHAMLGSGLSAFAVQPVQKTLVEHDALRQGESIGIR